MSHLLHFEFRADSASGDTDTVTVEALWTKKSGVVISLGTFTSLPATVSDDAPWRTVEIDVSAATKGLTGKLEINRIAGEDNAHIRNVWITDYKARPNYGEYPKKFPYVPDVEDGVFAGVPILNDGGSGGQEYFAESGEPINPSDYNYSVDWGSKPAGYVHDFDNWINTGSLWTTPGAYQTGYIGGYLPPGTPTLTLYGHEWFPQIRYDGFPHAPHHNISMYVSTVGSRGMALVGPIWGWNSWSDFFFAVNGGHELAPHGPGVYRVQGGVPSFLGPLNSNSLGSSFAVQHDFLTGDLHVANTDFFMGGTIHYYGNHPHTVGAGHAGWMGDRQNGPSIFGDTTIVANWSNIFEPGHIAHQRQFSMETLSVVEQDPPTWYFGVDVPPPLRQRSRDDGLATDARQEKGSGSSQQTSLRRGGRVYY